MSFTWNLEFRDLMQILLGMSPQYGQTLLHIVALEGKGRGLDLHFVLLQMPKRWDTQLQLPFRNAWGVKERHLLSSPLTNKAWVLSPKASGSSLTSVWREVAPCWYVPAVTWWLWKPAHFMNALTLCGFSVAVCSLEEFCPFLMKYLCPPFLDVVSFLRPPLCSSLQLWKAKAASKFLLITSLWQCSRLLHSVAFRRILLCKLYCTIHHCL